MFHKVVSVPFFICNHIAYLFIFTLTVPTVHTVYRNIINILLLILHRSLIQHIHHRQGKVCVCVCVCVCACMCTCVNRNNNNTVNIEMFVTVSIYIYFFFFFIFFFIIFFFFISTCFVCSTKSITFQDSLGMFGAKYT